MASKKASHRRTPRTRKSLLLRLKNWRDEESWREFNGVYSRLIRQTALKAGLRHPEVEEVVQETLLTVAKKIAGFNYDPALGSFKNWLLQITRRRVVDYLRKSGSQVRGTKACISAGALDDAAEASQSWFETLWNQEWHEAMLSTAQARIKHRVSPKQFRIFELYVLEQRPIREVTAQLKVNAAQVYMAKYRINRLLRKEIQKLEEEEW